MLNSETQPVLYLGDTAQTAAAAYLSGVMHHAGIAFDYCPSSRPIGGDLHAADRKLIILSDYPSAQLTPDQHEKIVAAVAGGTGLLMIGGWESYHGLGGDWDTSPIADLLPVTISPSDDRVNYDQTALLRTVTPNAGHPIVTGLPWDTCPPAIGGYCRFTAKPDAQVLLEVALHQAARQGDGFNFDLKRVDPMLVVSPPERSSGAVGKGNVACLATDAAPHWVGPFVDWGTDNDPQPSGSGRLPCQAPGAGEVEVGKDYAQFFTQLVRWTAGLGDRA